MLPKASRERFTAWFLGADLREEVRLREFREIYEVHQSYVRKTLYWMVGESALDDLVQEVFLKVWQKYWRFRGEAAIRTWIYRITVNTANDFFRKQKNTEKSVPASSESEFEHSPESHMETKDLIQKGMKKLNTDLRAVFTLFYIQNLPIEEIANVLKVPSGTIKSRLHQARTIFGKFLEANGVRV